MRHASKLGGHLILKISKDPSSNANNSEITASATPTPPTVMTTLPKSPSVRTIHSTLSNKVFHVIKVDEDKPDQQTEGAASSAAATSVETGDIGLVMKPASPLPDASGSFIPSDLSDIPSSSADEGLLNVKIKPIAPKIPSSFQHHNEDEHENHGSKEMVVQANDDHILVPKPVFQLTDGSQEQLVSQSELSKKSSSSSRHILVPQLSLPSRLVDDSAAAMESSSRKSSESNIMLDQERPSFGSSLQNDADQNNTSSGSGEMQGVKKSFQSLKVPILSGRSQEKQKKKLSFQGKHLSKII